MHFYISESKVKKNAKGLFTSQSLKKGTVIFFDYHLVADRRTRFFEEDYVQSELSRMIVHSKTPNTMAQLMDNKKKIARKCLRDIKEGEELTSDYGQLKEIITGLGYIYNSIEE